MIVVEDIYLPEGTKKKSCCIIYCIDFLPHSPPVGAGYIAAALKKEGIPYRFYTVVMDDPESVSEWLDSIKEETCLFSVYDWNLHLTKQVIEMIRKTKENSRIIVGGLSCYAYDEVMELLNPDYVVVGEGEKTIIDLLTREERNLTLSDIKGIAYKNGKETTFNGEREPTDINTTASPYIEQVFSKRYRRATYSLIRGCIFNCTYCYWGSPKNAGTFRVKDINLAFRELEKISKNGIRRIQSTAAVFNFSTEYLRNIQIGLEERNIKFDWFDADCRADLLTEEQIQIMKKLGVKEVGLGIETINKETQERIRKHLDPKTIRPAIDLLRKYGMKIHVSMQLGLPGEGAEDAKKTFDFVKSLKTDEVGIFHTLLQPGTQIYNEMKKSPEKHHAYATARYADNPRIDRKQINTLIGAFFKEVQEISTKKLYIFQKYHPYKITPNDDGYTMTIYLRKLKEGDLIIGVNECPEIMKKIKEINIHADKDEAETVEIEERARKIFPKAHITTIRADD